MCPHMDHDTFDLNRLRFVNSQNLQRIPDDRLVGFQCSLGHKSKLLARLFRDTGYWYHMVMDGMDFAVRWLQEFVYFRTLDADEKNC